MPRVSKRFLQKDLFEDLRTHFSSLIASLQEDSQIRNFTRNFFTPEEQIMLMKRLMLHMMLANGYQTGHISSLLGVSRETIRVHKTAWIKSPESYKQIIKSLSKKEKTREIWEKIERLLAPIDLALKISTDMKSRAKFGSGEWVKD